MPGIISIKKEEPEMKRSMLIIASMILLSSCGDTSIVDSIAEKQTGNTETIVIPEMTKTAEQTDESIISASETVITLPDAESIGSSEDGPESEIENTINEEKNVVSERDTYSDDEYKNTMYDLINETTDIENDKYPEVDLDLTGFDSNMVYATVYDMMFNGDQYLGQVIKVRGIFGYYKDEDTGDEFFGVVISDATACCSQGIEFVLDGEYTYPDDYPKLGTDITVTGVFDYYTEGHGIYLQLLHADMKINANDEDDQ